MVIFSSDTPFQRDLFSNTEFQKQAVKSRAKKRSKNTSERPQQFAKEFVQLELKGKN